MAWQSRVFRSVTISRTAVAISLSLSLSFLCSSAQVGICVETDCQVTNKSTSQKLIAKELQPPKGRRAEGDQLGPPTEGQHDGDCFSEHGTATDLVNLPSVIWY